MGNLFADKEVQNYLDDKNQALMAKLRQKVDVQFTKWDKDYYASQRHKNQDGSSRSVEIFYKEPLEQSKFAHELLHMETDLALGDTTKMCNYVESSNSNYLKFILDEDFCTDILNVTQHIAFAPKYKDMGYDLDKQFEQERNYDNINKAFDDVISNKVKADGKYYLLKVKNYLKLMVMYIFYPTPKRFANKINQLKPVEYPLYHIVKELHRAFTSKNNNRYEFIQRSYMNFALDIEKWLKRNDQMIHPYSML